MKSASSGKVPRLSLKPADESTLKGHPSPRSKADAQQEAPAAILGHRCEGDGVHCGLRYSNSFANTPNISHRHVFFCLTCKFNVRESTITFKSAICTQIPLWAQRLDAGHHFLRAGNLVCPDDHVCRAAALGLSWLHAVNKHAHGFCFIIERHHSNSRTTSSSSFFF